jgi:integrative and conjugative element protein (TIGR02256 family)
MKKIWISESAFQFLREEAGRAYPLETGGVLLGYFATNGEPVVYAAIGPGPAAIHRRTRFTPDHEWQSQQIDNVFESSKEKWTYVGDWHTHPRSSPRMSYLDQRTLKNIAEHTKAWAPYPVMLIGGGAPHDWKWVGHQYRNERLWGLLAGCDERSLHVFPFE